jgi:hypothetical protein
MSIVIASALGLAAIAAAGACYPVASTAAPVRRIAPARRGEAPVW